jgi:hypothetical protein
MVVQEILQAQVQAKETMAAATELKQVLLTQPVAVVVLAQ